MAALFKGAFLKPSRYVCWLSSLLVAALLLSGCGFHLRGSIPLPPALHVLAIQSDSPFGTMTQQLTQMLKSMGADIVPLESHPPVTLVIVNESFSQESITQSASSSVQQYLMYYSVNYQVTDSTGKILFGPKTITVKQLYSVNQNQVLSADTQQQELQRELIQAAVLQLLSQLSAAEAQAALTPKKTP